MSLKTFAKNWLPPIVVRALIRLRSDRIRFEGNYPTWGAAAAQCSGYNTNLIFKKVLDATLKVKHGEAAFERDSVLFDKIEYSWPVTAALMWVAAQSGGKLDVLDFGGSLGTSYFQNLAFLANLPQVRWSVVEQKHYVQAGQDYIQDDKLRFFTTIEQCLLHNMPNVILLSSVLQYLPEVDQLFKKINNSTAKFIIVDRTPFSKEQDDRICVQKVPQSIYEASYPMRIFSLNKFMARLEGWHVVENIHSPEGSLVTCSDLEINFKGFILKLVNAE